MPTSARFFLGRVTGMAVARRPVRRRLSSEERATIFETLNSERFVDAALPQVYATLLDEGVYLCSISTSKGSSPTTATGAKSAAPP